MKQFLRRALIYFIGVVFTIPMYFVFLINGKKPVAVSKVWGLLTTDHNEK